MSGTVSELIEGPVVAYGAPGVVLFGHTVQGTTPGRAADRDDAVGKQFDKRRLH